MPNQKVTGKDKRGQGQDGQGRTRTGFGQDGQDRSMARTEYGQDGEGSKTGWMVNSWMPTCPGKSWAGRPDENGTAQSEAILSGHFGL